MRATVRDVAARAGVSPKTVSNVINGVVFVRPDTRERVEKAVADLQYVPNLSARGLRNGRTGAIAVAFPDLSMEYSAEMLDEFVEVAHEKGWTIQLEQTAKRPERERELLSRGREHLIDGLVLNPISLEASAVAVDSDDLPPVVLIGEVEVDVVDRVSLDSVAAARDMTTHLAGLGHTRIAAVGTNGAIFDSATARVRTEGYRQGLQAAGLPLDPALEIEVEDWSPGDAGAAILRALDAGVAPDAIFCFTDTMATGVLSALSGRRIRVPDDVSVVGFDDVASARFASPPLTTVSFDKHRFAEVTLTMLSDRVNDRSLPPRAVRIPHAIVERESVRSR